MMASTQEVFVPEVYRCYHCGSESSDNAFKYFDNKKMDQPRYRCHHCRKYFTLGSHGRPQGKTYAKKRNEDPEELKSLPRQCCHCGVANHAVFKYYNNNSLSQPRFKCLTCGKQFQMRLLGFGEERRLVHTSSGQRTRAPQQRKQRVHGPITDASSSSEFEDGSYQPFDGSFLPVPSDPLMMPLESTLLPEMSDDNAQYVDFLEGELAQQESTQADPISCTASGDDGNLPWPSIDEAVTYSQLLEAELLTEDNEAPNVDSPANVDGELPSTWSCDDDAQFMDFIEAGGLMAAEVDMVSNDTAEMVSESSSNNVEVMYGTLEVDRPDVPSDFDSWSPSDTSVDPSNMSYADAAAACCYQMDLDMARENSMVAVASVDSSMSFAEAAAACCRQMDLDMARESSMVAVVSS